MATTKRKNKRKDISSEKKHRAGVVGFTIEDVRKAQEAQDSVNAKAYEYMVEAMAVSANYVHNDTITENGEIRMDDVYPTSLDETLRMDELLDRSERAVKDDNDSEYNLLISELRGIVGWSRRRHFNFSWWVILGTLITVAAVMYWSNSDKQTKQQRQRTVAQIKAWDTDNDSITLERAMEEVSYNNMYNSPTYYKAYTIKSAKERYTNQLKSNEDYRQRLDTATLASNKKNYAKWIKDGEKSAEKYQQQYEEASGWSLKNSKKVALKDAKKSLSAASKAAAFSYTLMVFFLLLIPLYIIANYSWGYNITKHREESRILETIRKWGFGAAGALFGAGLAMEATTEYRVHWSDGSKTNETEINYATLALKAMLYIAAVVIIAVVSTCIMIYSTIVGLKRNYDWAAIIEAAKKYKK